MKKKKIWMSIIASAVLVLSVINVSGKAEGAVNEEGYIEESRLETKVDSEEKMPCIINIESQKEKVTKGQRVIMNLTIDNISEENKNFPIHKMTDIDSEKVVIRYDKDKLKFGGFFGGTECFVGYNSTYDNEKGEICMDINADVYENFTEKMTMFKLIFIAIDTGEAKVEVTDASTIKDTAGNINTLKDGRTGGSIISIS